MQDPMVEIWEGAALAKAPSVGAQPAGFVRAAVLRWRDVPAAVPPRSRPSPLRIAELWTGPGVVVAGAAGALTVSTALTDGARVVTTNLAVADATIPPEALLAVVDGDVVAAHAERVAALCAERATSAQAPASWRDAPLVVALGAQTALALHETLERLNAVRSGGALLGLFVAQFVLSRVVSWVTGDPVSREYSHSLWPLSLWACLFVAADWVVWLARRRVRKLVPDFESEPRSTRAIASKSRYWILEASDPRIDVLSLAQHATRATLTATGFVRRGAIRKKADFGKSLLVLGSPWAEDLRAGRSVEEVWMEDRGIAIGNPNVSAGEPLVEYLTLLSDASLVATAVFGPQSYNEMAWNLQTVPSVGVYWEVWAGVPGPEYWDAHQRFVDGVRAKTGAQVVPVRTLEDALFLKRLYLRKARSAGAATGAAELLPWRSWKVVVASAGFLVAATLLSGGSADGVATAFFLVFGVWALMVVGAIAARASGPKNRTLAQLRALPCRQFPDGAVGDWLE